MLVYFLLVAVAGLVAGYLVSLIFAFRQRQKDAGLLYETINRYEFRLKEIEKELVVANERLKIFSERADSLDNQLKTSVGEKLFMGQQIVREQTEYKALQEKLNNQKAEIETLQKKFSAEFENLASKILKQNTEAFIASNQRNIADILNPLKEKIQLFEKKVEDTYVQGVKDQTDLKAELKMLHELNKRLGDEAQNLTRALKGDVKKQGNWGELVLEKILERSGLTEGREFVREMVINTPGGNIIRPDVVILLPGNKHLVIDSKVSLVAYEKMVSSDSDDQRIKWQKEHLGSIKSHIKELSQKHYQTAPGLNTPDFVLLFVPIESSFSVAIQEDQDLFSFAWDQKVVIVSPGTLLASLRTISSIWKQENQTRNAMEIARQGGALYDKFVGFLEDMESIGSNVETLRKNLDKAMNKLSLGRGNLINSAERLKELGAKTSKEIPQKMLDE